jgi:hypothetical protein
VVAKILAISSTDVCVGIFAVTAVRKTGMDAHYRLDHACVPPREVAELW